MGMSLVTGAGGFVGGHLVAALLERGEDVRAVDKKLQAEWQQLHRDAHNHGGADLTYPGPCATLMGNADAVYNLAADMGGMGFIESHKADCMLSVLINTNLLRAAQRAGLRRYFFSSSACVYPDYRQKRTNDPALREADAYPAMAEDGYGWEKLFSERMCRHFREDYGMETRVARYHNVYGPHGTYDGGREKAPAALCRKIAMAKISGNHSIDIWGDGEQTRSFMYIDDAIVGTLRLMASDFHDPINIGSSELVSINQLVSLIEEIAGIKVERNYIPGPLGVRGRNSDNTLIRQTLNWEPGIPLKEGLQTTYRWIYDRLATGS